MKLGDMITALILEEARLEERKLLTTRRESRLSVVRMRADSSNDGFDEWDDRIIFLIHRLERRERHLQWRLSSLQRARYALEEVVNTLEHDAVARTAARGSGRLRGDSI